MRSVFGGLVAVLVLAASCGDSDDSSPSTADDTDSSTTTSTTASTDGGDSAAAPEPSTDGQETTEPAAPVALRFTVEGVVGGQNVPVEHTCDGDNEVPPVTIEGVPDDVEELALVVDDPDAPTDDPFVHWVVYGIGPDTTTVTDGDASLSYGTNDAGTDTWFGPCPPPADGLHTYRWKLYGLSSALDLEPGLDGRAVEEAIAAAVVTDALLISSYERAG